MYNLVIVVNTSIISKDVSVPRILRPSVIHFIRLITKSCFNPLLIIFFLSLLALNVNIILYIVVKNTILNFIIFSNGLLHLIDLNLQENIYKSQKREMN